MRAILLGLSVVLPLALGACQSMASGEDFARAAGGRVWFAEAIGGRDVVDGTRVTLKFEDGRVNGRAGCNSYGGKAEINGAQLKISMLISTKMACMAPGVMEQESRYLNALEGATRGEVRHDGALVITTGRGAIVFREE